MRGIAVASVASESQIFPAARPLPGPRGAGAQDHAVGAEPGGFAQLLDSKPADDREAPARSKRERSDEAAAAKGNRRSNDAAHTKRAKDKAAAKDETSEPTETTAEAKTEETSGDAQQASNDKPAEASSEPANTESQSATTDADVATDTTTDGATVMIAAADAIVPAAAAVEAPAAAAPTVAVAAVVLPETASPVVQAAVPTEIAPAAGAAAAPAAPAAQTPAAPAVVAGDGGETPAVNARPAVKATPATPATRAAPATSATPATPAVPPTETVEGDAGKALADQMSNRPEKVSAERAPAPKAEAAPDPAMRSQDSAAAVKTGADLVQNLGVNAPVHHAAPTQSTAAANAAAAAAPTPAPAATVPVAGLAVEIAAQSNAGRNRFEIRLDPPELGRIDVRLEIDGDGHVKSRLIVERSETLDMLRRDAPQLERALQQAGLKTSDNALEFSLRDQAPQRDDDNQKNATRLVVPDEGATSLDTIQHNYGRLLGLGSGLDIRV